MGFVLSNAVPEERAMLLTFFPYLDSTGTKQVSKSEGEPLKEQSGLCTHG
jgi:hypothetical protein